MSKMSGNEPLLYVAQPQLEKPVSEMQGEYISFYEKEEVEQVPEEKMPEGSFKTLSIEEKITYLLNLPNEFIQMKCKIETGDETFRGSILERTEDKIEMIQSGRKKVTIPISNIKTIELIGL